MTLLQTVGTVIGFIGVAEGFFIFLSTRRSVILTCKLIGDLLFILNYLFVGSVTGAIISVIALCRETVFYFRGKKRWADAPVWLVLFLLAMLISPIADFGKIGGFSLLPLLPAIAGMLTVIGLYNKNTRVTKIFYFLAQFLYIPFQILSKSYTGAINYAALAASFVTLASTVIGYLREVLLKKAETQAEEKNS